MRKELETAESATRMREVEKKLDRIEKLATALISLIDELREFVAEEKAKKSKRRPLIY